MPHLPRISAHLRFLKFPIHPGIGTYRSCIVIFFYCLSFAVVHQQIFYFLFNFAKFEVFGVGVGGGGGRGWEGTFFVVGIINLVGESILPVPTWIFLLT